MSDWGHGGYRPGQGRKRTCNCGECRKCKVRIWSRNWWRRNHGIPLDRPVHQDDVAAVKLNQELRER